MRLKILAVILALTALPLTASAVPITIDPDAFAAGTNLTNAFAGVTLQTCDSVAPGINCRAVLSGADAGATTGTLVFAQNNGDTTWGNGIFEFLKASFAGGATAVSLDFFANDAGGDANAQLFAYDAGGILVDSDAVAFVAGGGFATLSVSAGNIAYIAAYWDEIGRSHNGGLDHLVYQAVPEPGVFALLLFAGAAAGLRKRFSL